MPNPALSFMQTPLASHCVMVSGRVRLRLAAPMDLRRRFKYYGREELSPYNI